MVVLSALTFWRREEVLKAKQKYPQVQMILLLPYPGYTKYWKQEDQERFATVWPHCTYKYIADSYHKGPISNGTENWLKEAIPASVT
ncbi:MAG: SLOG family protein [Lachnospiraceae bacterium]